MAGALESLKEDLINVLPAQPTTTVTYQENAVQHAPAQETQLKAPVNEFYAIRSITGKGYGCFALKDLKRGTRILSDTPLVTVSEGNYLIADIEESFAKLSDEDKELYWSLASSHGQDPKAWPGRIHESVQGREVVRIKEQHEARVAKEPSLLSIFQTNCMEWGKGAAIFPKAARFNHCCSPNANFNWNDKLQRETIHIIHDLKKGDEITFSYCDMTHEKTLRAWELKHYGFACDCEACAGDDESPDSFARQSAERRYRMAELDRVTGYLRGPNLEQGVKEPEFVQGLMDLAVLHLEIGDYSMRLANIYVDLALACEYAHDFKNGQDMAANALRVKRDCQGADSTDFERYKGILKRLHRSYKAAQRRPAS